MLFAKQVFWDLHPSAENSLLFQWLALTAPSWGEYFLFHGQGISVYQPANKDIEQQFCWVPFHSWVLPLCMHHFTWNQTGFLAGQMNHFTVLSMSDCDICYLLLTEEKAIEHRLLVSSFSKYINDNQKVIWTYWKSMVRLTFSPKIPEFEVFSFTM